MTDEKTLKSPRKFALYSGITALLAFAACNGFIVLTAILAIFGIAFTINPHFQAALISLFAILTSILVFKGFRHHFKSGPLILAGVATVTILLTMYVSYSKTIESIALAGLIIAAGWNWHLTRQGH